MDVRRGLPSGGRRPSALSLRETATSRTRGGPRSFSEVWKCGPGSENPMSLMGTQEVVRMILFERYCGGLLVVRTRQDEYFRRRLVKREGCLPIDAEQFSQVRRRSAGMIECNGSATLVDLNESPNERPVHALNRYVAAIIEHDFLPTHLIRGQWRMRRTSDGEFRDTPNSIKGDCVWLGLPAAISIERSVETVNPITTTPKMIGMVEASRRYRFHGNSFGRSRVGGRLTVEQQTAASRGTSGNKRKPAIRSK